MGAFTGTGPTVTWRLDPAIKGPLTAGVNVVITLTVIDKYQAVENNVDRRAGVPRRGPGRALSGARLSDGAQRARAKFLGRFVRKLQVPPAACLVDFSEVGKCAKELMMRGHCLQSVRGRDSRRSSSTARLSGERFVSATVVSDAEFFDKWLNPAPGQQEFTSTHADFVLTAIYDADRWWLCESTYTNVKAPASI